MWTDLSGVQGIQRTSQAVDRTQAGGEGGGPGNSSVEVHWED